MKIILFEGSEERVEVTSGSESVVDLLVRADESSKEAVENCLRICEVGFTRDDGTYTIHDAVKPSEWDGNIGVIWLRDRLDVPIGIILKEA